MVRLQPASISSGEALFGITVQGAEEGAKANKKRCKQRCQEATTDVDGGINKRVGDSSVKHAAEVVGNNKHWVRLPKDHIKKLLKETCLNHAYAIKHKLRDCSLIKNFMTTGFLSRDELPS
jgi:hypothetical protein